MTTGSILIVDDERSQREILTIILRKEGYHTTDVAGVDAQAVGAAGDRLQREAVVEVNVGHEGYMDLPADF